MKYTLSFLTKRYRTTIEIPHWWQFWKSPKTNQEPYWDRKAAIIESEKPEEQLIEIFNSDEFKQFISQTNNGVHGLNFETNQYSSFIPTTDLNDTIIDDGLKDN